MTPLKFQKAIALPVFPFKTIFLTCLKSHKERLSCFRFYFPGNQEPEDYSPPSRPKALSGRLEDEGIVERNILKKAETASLPAVMISPLDLLFHTLLSRRGGRMSWEETLTHELSAESDFSFTSSFHPSHLPAPHEVQPMECMEFLLCIFISRNFYSKTGRHDLSMVLHQVCTRAGPVS